MATTPNRLERITNLFLALLETPRPISLREIGVAVPGYPSEPFALRQAFERDKRILREEGVPIAVERIGGAEQVGYRILPEDYYLPDLGLDPEEREALAFALAAVRIEGGVGAGAVEKLSPGAAPPLPPVAILPALPALPLLHEAIRRRRVVEFDYASSTDPSAARGRTRRVEGQGLVFRLGAWYFVGRDRTAGGEMRTFRVDRFEGGLNLGPPDGYEEAAGEAAGALRFARWAAAPGAAPTSGAGSGGIEANMTVVLDVDVRSLGYARALLGEAALIERAEDGSGRFRFEVADEDAFVVWVIAQGDAVEVVAPAPLRARVVERLAELAGKGLAGKGLAGKGAAGKGPAGKGAR